MDKAQNLIVIISITVFCAVVIYDGATSRQVGRAIGNLVVIGFVVASLNNFTGFPEHRVAFGVSRSEITIAFMFLFMVLGMIANHIFFSKTIVVREMLRPILVSPIVFIPLQSLIDGAQVSTFYKSMTLCFVAFQNGFFWQVIFDKAAIQAREN